MKSRGKPRAAMNIEDLLIKKYSGEETIEMAVQVEVPGSWFNNMSAEEKKKDFLVIPVEYSTCREFGSNKKMNKKEGVRIQVCSSKLISFLRVV